MQNGYTLGTEKLSKKEFEKKYWMGGDEEYVYQFHSMDIEDGLDERQQLLINNDRALFKSMRELWKEKFENTRKIGYLETDLNKSKKAITALVIINTVIVGIVITVLLF